MPDEEPGSIVRTAGWDHADRTIRYRIDGEMAHGGMGSVLKGRDPDLGRDVPLKVLREDLRDNADMVRRFVEEALEAEPKLGDDRQAERKQWQALWSDVETLLNRAAGLTP